MKKSVSLQDDKNKQCRISRDKIGIDTLERYTGSSASDFQNYILLTNFHRYLSEFANKYSINILEGSAMRSCHSESAKISVIDYGIGSPMAALIVELLSFIKPKAVLMLGMCGGLRNDYEIGDFFNPVAAIRGEGTSNAFMPSQCPALSSFVIQRYICENLESQNLKYHNGVIHTTNVRFWEFNEKFKETIKKERVQSIDMECATLFAVGFAKYVPVGALMLISDLPLKADGIKTKNSAKSVFNKFTDLHLQTGISVLKNMQKNEKKGFQYNF